MRGARPYTPESLPRRRPGALAERWFLVRITRAARAELLTLARKAGVSMSECLSELVLLAATKAGRSKR